VDEPADVLLQQAQFFRQFEVHRVLAGASASRGSGMKPRAESITPTKELPRPADGEECEARHQFPTSPWRSDMKAYQTLLIEKNEGITTIRLNRPDKKNAMNPTMHREMHDALQDLEWDNDTQVLVITGSGNAFCAGQDLKEYFYANKDSERER